MMSDGSLKRIGSVAVGDEVVTFDLITLKLSSTKVVACLVRETDKPIFRVTTVSGRSIVATGDHKFFTDQGWMSVSDFEVNETRTVVFMKSVAKPLDFEAMGCHFAIVRSIERLEQCTIADITTESSNHCFIAGDGFGVHNSAMGKQAISVYASNFRHRFDTIGHVLNYPQRPLVNTHIANLLHGNDLPSGMNAIVAIATYTGFNQVSS